MYRVSPISLVVILILTLITDASTVYLYLSGTLLTVPHALIAAVSSGTAATMLMVFTLGAGVLITAWVLTHQSNEP